MPACIEVPSNFQLGDEQEKYTSKAPAVDTDRKDVGAPIKRLAHRVCAEYATPFNWRDTAMAKNKFASMSVEALIKMRDDIEKILSNKAGQLQRQLAALGNGGWASSGKGAVGRPKGSGSKLKGRKVSPKYRNPKNQSETWAGRGAMPKWMAAEIKAGKKKESFLIHNGK